MHPAVAGTPAKWKCIERCGACCKLGDFDMDVLKGMLRDEKDVAEYLDMIADDGWCRHFDSISRKCAVYADRPRFCRATPEVFHDLYDVEPDNFDAFAIDCCQCHIANSFGEDSHEADRYSQQVIEPFARTQQCAGE